MTNKEFKRFMELFKKIFNVPFERIYLGREPIYMIPRQWGDFRIEFRNCQMSVRSIPYPTLFMNIPITFVWLSRRGPDEYGGYTAEFKIFSGEREVVQVCQKYVETKSEIIEFEQICNEYNEEWKDE